MITQTTSYIPPGLNDVWDQRAALRSKGSAIQKPSPALPPHGDPGEAQLHETASIPSSLFPSEPGLHFYFLPNPGSNECTQHSR